MYMRILLLVVFFYPLLFCAFDFRLQRSLASLSLLPPFSPAARYSTPSSPTFFLLSHWNLPTWKIENLYCICLIVSSLRWKIFFRGNNMLVQFFFWFCKIFRLGRHTSMRGQREPWWNLCIAYQWKISNSSHCHCEWKVWPSVSIPVGHARAIC